MPVTFLQSLDRPALQVPKAQPTPTRLVESVSKEFSPLKTPKDMHRKNATLSALAYNQTPSAISRLSAGSRQRLTQTKRSKECLQQSRSPMKTPVKQNLSAYEHNAMNHTQPFNRQRFQLLSHNASNLGSIANSNKYTPIKDFNPMMESRD